jgi:hypothetical protein
MQQGFVWLLDSLWSGQNEKMFGCMDLHQFLKSNMHESCLLTWMHVGRVTFLHALVRLPLGSSRGKQQQQQRSSQYYINLKSKTTMTKACINIIAASTKITISFHIAPTLFKLQYQSLHDALKLDLMLEVLHGMPPKLLLSKLH